MLFKQTLGTGRYQLPGPLELEKLRSGMLSFCDLPSPPLQCPPSMGWSCWGLRGGSCGWVWGSGNVGCSPASAKKNPGWSHKLFRTSVSPLIKLGRCTRRISELCCGFHGAILKEFEFFRRQPLSKYKSLWLESLIVTKLYRLKVNEQNLFIL